MELGTLMVKDILLDDGFGGEGSGSPQELTVFNGVLFTSLPRMKMVRNCGKSDGTSNSTAMLKEIYAGE